MSHPTVLRAPILFLALLMIPAGIARADTEAERTRIHRQIQELQQQLDRTKSQRENARSALRQLEQRINQQGKSLERTRVQLRSARRKLRQLESRRSRMEAGMAHQRQQLGQEARTALVVGRQPYLKVLLSQQDPDTVSRVLTYYRYFALARADRISTLHDKLASLETLQEKIRGETRTLELAQKRYEENSRGLKHSRSQRRTLLASLDRRVHSQSERIRDLRQAEKRLDRLMGELDVKETQTRTLPSGTKPFRRLRGKLPLPASGRITARFGAPRTGYGDMRWKGIFIRGREGQQVRAIYPGKIVFADRLEGYGLLLIIEHGDGYMTLYGNNESLYKKVGDPVEAGQVIASMGSTGSPFHPGLYFEVRHQGKPNDPLRWCALR
ncbi:MAG: peptidoglycan DD-metalloendopeptidase family protein [Acidiferrobacteraceae bacterium]|jgi:septal ring factor EnvC (AmiA/AmiB activator)